MVVICCSLFERFISAPEARHGLAQAIREAEKAKEEGKEKMILFNLCGHGFVDMSAYEDYSAGKLSDHYFTDEELKKNLQEVRDLSVNQQ